MTTIDHDIVARHEACAEYLRGITGQVERGEYWQEWSSRFGVRMTTEGIENLGEHYFPYPAEEPTPHFAGGAVSRSDIDLALKFPPRKATKLTSDHFELARQKFHLCDRTIRHNYYLDRITLETGNRSRMLEIGGGAGILSSLFHAEHGCSNIIIDLPEMLILSSAFILTLFPDRRIILPNELGKSLSPDEYDFALIPANMTQMVRPLSFDLIVNTASFMEMDFHEVKAYFDLIDETLEDGGYFFCSNRMRKRTNFFKYPWKQLRHTEDVFVERCRTRPMQPKKNQFADRLVRRHSSLPTFIPFRTFLKSLFWGRWAPSALFQRGLPNYHRDNYLGFL